MKYSLLKNKNKIYVKLIFFIIFLLGIIFFYNQKKSEIPYVLADGESDGIAVRVITNPEHYSPARWHKEQGFFGSPQSLIVDGYEAVREGRTVYVNVANIDDKGTTAISDDSFYTNIYLISYSQNADNATKEIFNQLIERWKFNSNIDISGFCSTAVSEQCSHDSDCPAGEFCSSQKAKITRDTRRLADLKEIQINLEIAKSTYGYYPKLGSGTYLPNSTVSVWPSWQDNLAKELGIKIPLGPINKLSICCPLGASFCEQSYNYNENTCWDKQNKAFAGSISSSLASVLSTGSFAYTYSSNSNGLECYLCAVLETNYSNLISDLNPPYTYCLY